MKKLLILFLLSSCKITYEPVVKPVPIFDVVKSRIVYQDDYIYEPPTEKEWFIKEKDPKIIKVDFNFEKDINVQRRKRLLPYTNSDHCVIANIYYFHPLFFKTKYVDYFAGQTNGHYQLVYTQLTEEELRELGKFVGADVVLASIFDGQYYYRWDKDYKHFNYFRGSGNDLFITYDILFLKKGYEHPDCMGNELN